MAKYGKTYWGAQFLNALNHIDYSNRLPRGRTYASNNYVKSIREEFLTEPLFLHGSLTRKARQALIDEFQDKPHRKIFILSLKAGGTGLNLTAAQNVIHFDLWWNPAVERQATDRAYRIGQKNKVMVYRLINKGTLEERIDEMLRDKGLLADLAVSTGEKWLGELNNKELKELVQLSKNM